MKPSRLGMPNKNGWDLEEGFRLEMLSYDSGKQLMAGMNTAHWEIAACGAIPALTASLDNQAEIIAIGNDESLATGIYARKDSPILGHTGYNALYPEWRHGRHGTRETILCTAGSSAHYTVHKWLEALSLTEKEVTIKDMPSEEALKAFLSGEGDAVALWSPYTLEAEQHGLMPVTLSSQCDASQPTLLLANKAFAKEHPALVTAFLKMYFRGITALQETPREQLIQDYRAFYHAWTGRDLPPQDAAWELAKHPVYGLKGQLTLFDPAQKKLHTWLQELASFAGGKNRLSDVTDVYLKQTRPIAPHSPSKTERQPSRKAGVFFVWDAPLKLSIKPDQANKHVLIFRQYSFVALFLSSYSNAITYSHSIFILQRRTKNH